MFCPSRLTENWSGIAFWQQQQQKSLCLAMENQTHRKMTKKLLPATWKKWQNLLLEFYH